MKLKYKSYRLQKTENYIKNNKILLVFNNINKTSIKKTDESETLRGHGVHSVSNSIVIKVLKSSIYCNFTFLINGPIVLVVLQFKDNYNNLHFFKKIISSKGTKIFLGLKLNKKFYSHPQLLSLNTLDYSENIKFLHGSLNDLLGLPFKKWKTVSK